MNWHNNYTNWAELETILTNMVNWVGEYKYVSYDELNVKAKMNCLTTYMYKICAYEHFDDLKNIEELEDCVREFWEVSEYTLDKDGNWYDEDSNRI